MTLDRALQRRILETCAECYPAMTLGPEHFAPDDQLMANLTYLQEHGLLEVNQRMSLEGGYLFLGARATHRGMDFLAKDGGLTAILGVVTIRLHDDTIKNLVALKIQEADLPPADKQRYLDQLRELPAETTKHLVLKLVDMGLEQGPRAMSWLGTFLGT